MIRARKQKNENKNQTKRLMSLLRYAWLFVRDGAGPWLEDRAKSALQHWATFGGGYKALALGGLCGGTILYLLIWYRVVVKERKGRALKLEGSEDGTNNDPNPHCFDACVVGGGPAGLSSAYHMASAGMRVLVLEKAHYPRDKICGDIVTPAVQSALKEMGIWQRIMERGAYRWVNKVGLLGGGSSSSAAGALRSHRPVAVQRIVLDHELAMGARQAGAHLAEGHAVVGAELAAEEGVWRVRCENGAQFECLVLVCADGAQSWLATQLGVVREPPNGVGKRVFLGPGSASSFPVDYVLRVNVDSTSVAVREVDDYVCQTIVSLSSSADSSSGSGSGFLYDGAYASRSVDECPMRLGGLSGPCFANRLLIVGDAAGLCDPLTGFGVAYALQSGRAAARTLVEALATGDVSERTLARYQSRVANATRVDFGISKGIRALLKVYPRLTRACIAVIRERGVLFFSEWVGAMQSSKRLFISPGVALSVLWEAIKQEVSSNHA